MKAKSVVLVMGVCGTGKSTLAEAIAKTTDAYLVEADLYHSEENKAKMHAGHPLTDADRQGWLQAIRDKISSEEGSFVLACSALKARYRRMLLEGQGATAVVFLTGDAEVIRQRLEERKGHFAGPDLLASQLATLEVPTADEGWKILVTVDVALAAEKQLAIAMEALQDL